MGIIFYILFIIFLFTLIPFLGNLLFYFVIAMIVLGVIGRLLRFFRGDDRSSNWRNTTTGHSQDTYQSNDSSSTYNQSRSSSNPDIIDVEYSQKEVDDGKDQ